MVDLSKFQELLEQDMSRKEFLRYVGVAILGIVGVTNFANNVSKSVLVTNKNTTGKNASGYGMSAYGR